jgi:hypothetical protein
MKRDKNYKMSKRLKTLLALLPFKSTSDRNVFKNVMIDAELASQSQRTRKE